MELLDQIPCPVLATDGAGRILSANNELLRLIGGTVNEWREKTLDNLLPPASRIFLQTHVWPMLLTQGSIQEIQLQLLEANGQRVPILVNGKKGVLDGSECYYWVFFVSLERSRFEGELLKARNFAQASSQALAKSERFIKTVTDGLPLMIAYWDKDLICRFANKPYQTLFANTPNSVLGSTMVELLGQSLATLNQPHIDRVLQGNPEQFERRVERPDGTQACFLTTYLPDMDAKSVVTGFFVLISDVTQLKKAEVELKLAASVFDSISEGIMIIDANETVLSVNAAFTDITGYAAKEMMGRVPRVLNAIHHQPSGFEEMRAALESTGHWEGEVWDRRKDGDNFMAWQSITMIRGTDGKAARFVLVCSDITARWKSNERTKHLALHDQLTGLPNRHLLLERLDQSMARAQREGRNLALFFVDLDGFKSINDQWGHAAGDEVLKFVANTLLDILRTTDTVARLGGDEFVLLIDNPENREEVAHLADRVIAAIKLPPSLQQTDARISASIGVSMLGVHADSVDRLMKNADSAMYAAKSAGKNRFLFFTPAMQSDH